MAAGTAAAVVAAPMGAEAVGILAEVEATPVLAEAGILPVTREELRLGRLEDLVVMRAVAITVRGLTA